MFPDVPAELVFYVDPYPTIETTSEIKYRGNAMVIVDLCLAGLNPQSLLTRRSSPTSSILCTLPPWLHLHPLYSSHPRLPTYFPPLRSSYTPGSLGTEAPSLFSPEPHPDPNPRLVSHDLLFNASPPPACIKKVGVRTLFPPEATPRTLRPTPGNRPRPAAERAAG